MRKGRRSSGWSLMTKGSLMLICSQQSCLQNAHGASLEQALLKVLPKLEIYNSKVTEKYGQWAIAFCAGILGVEQPMGSSNGDHMLSNVTTLDLSDRHLQVLLPNVFNADELPSLTSMNLQGNLFKDETPASLLRTLKSLVTLQSLQVDIPGPFGSAVSIGEALPNLYQLNGMSLSKILEGDKQFLTSDLKPRLHIWSPKEPLLEQVMSAMWQYVLTYRLADDEKLDETPIWYVMDELGSALRHSDDPNFQVAPFMFLPDGTLKSAISYTLMWPIEDVGKGNECMRDYLFGVGEDKQRSSRLTAWFHTPPDFFKQAYEVHCNELKQVKLMKGITDGSPTQSIHPSDGRPLRVYSDIPAVTDLLSQPEFILVEDILMADIIWTHMQIDDEFQKEVGLQRHQYVNQFPGETCFVMKHFLAQTVQKAYGSQAWMQPTYNMETQLPALIGDYLARQEKKQDNLWIVKPWNMARTIDTTVTGSLPALLRLVETGPKICQKYIEKPALYQGRKFDLRYIVLLRSIQPLEIFLSDVFWARFSNNQYTTDKSSLSEYDTHFTVMNYGGRPLNHINAHDWVPEFEKEHNVKWQDIHQRVRSVLRAVFEGAIATSPNMHSPTSRAIYGVDIMLDDSFQPKLLEVTYCPDCGRACNYDLKNILGDGELIRGSDFYNDVFSCLFLNECKHMCPL
ncbi:hypothetical protein CY35_05G094600 [Sphagnum magellanicum]|nr:hypothetical protein CY35_05G094600 [Sphagnum magellanicum]